MAQGSYVSCAYIKQDQPLVNPRGRRGESHCDFIDLPLYLEFLPMFCLGGDSSLKDMGVVLIPLCNKREKRKASRTQTDTFLWLLNTNTKALSHENKATYIDKPDIKGNTEILSRHHVACQGQSILETTNTQLTILKKQQKKVGLIASLLVYVSNEAQ